MGILLFTNKLSQYGSVCLCVCVSVYLCVPVSFSLGQECYYGSVSLSDCLLVLPGTGMLLLPMVDFSDMTVEGVLGAEDHLAVGAVQLFRTFMHLTKKKCAEE